MAEPGVQRDVLISLKLVSDPGNVAAARKLGEAIARVQKQAEQTQAASAKLPGGGGSGGGAAGSTRVKAATETAQAVFDVDAASARRRSRLWDLAAKHFVQAEGNRLLSAEKTEEGIDKLAHKLKVSRARLAQQAAKEQQKAEQQTRRVAEREADRAAKAKIKAEQLVTREAQRAASEKIKAERSAARESERLATKQQRDQDRVFRNRARLLDRISKDKIRAQQQTERAVELANAKRVEGSEQVSNEVRKSIQGALDMARGFAFLGIVGEDNLEKLAKGLVKVEAGFSVFRGATDLFFGIGLAMRRYREVVEATTAANEALAASQALVGGTKIIGGRGVVGSGGTGIAAALAGDAAAGGVFRFAKKGVSKVFGRFAGKGVVAAGATSLFPTFAKLGGMATKLGGVLGSAAATAGIFALKFAALPIALEEGVRWLFRLAGAGEKAESEVLAGIGAIKAWRGSVASAAKVTEMAALRKQRQDFRAAEDQKFLKRAQFEATQRQGLGDLARQRTELAFDGQLGLSSEQRTLGVLAGQRARDLKELEAAQANFEEVRQRNRQRVLAAEAGGGALDTIQSLEEEKSARARILAVSQKLSDSDKARVGVLRQQAEAARDNVKAAGEQLKAAKLLVATEKERLDDKLAKFGTLDPFKKAALRSIGQKLAAGGNLNQFDVRLLKETGFAGKKTREFDLKRGTAAHGLEFLKNLGEDADLAAARDKERLATLKIESAQIKASEATNEFDKSARKATKSLDDLDKAFNALRSILAEEAGTAAPVKTDAAAGGAKGPLRMSRNLSPGVMHRDLHGISGRDSMADRMKSHRMLGKQLGGVIAGVGTGDKVPILAEPGEFVLRKAAAKKLGMDQVAKANAAPENFELVDKRHRRGFRAAERTRPTDPLRMQRGGPVPAGGATRRGLLQLKRLADLNDSFARTLSRPRIGSEAILNTVAEALSQGWLKIVPGADKSKRIRRRPDESLRDFQGRLAQISKRLGSFIDDREHTLRTEAESQPGLKGLSARITGIGEKLAHTTLPEARLRKFGEIIGEGLYGAVPGADRKLVRRKPSESVEDYRHRLLRMSRFAALLVSTRERDAAFRAKRAAELAALPAAARKPSFPVVAAKPDFPAVARKPSLFDEPPVTALTPRQTAAAHRTEMLAEKAARRSAIRAAARPRRSRAEHIQILGQRHAARDIIRLERAAAKHTGGRRGERIQSALEAARQRLRRFGGVPGGGVVVQPKGPQIDAQAVAAAPAAAGLPAAAGIAAKPAGPQAAGTADLFAGVPQLATALQDAESLKQPAVTGAAVERRRLIRERLDELRAAKQQRRNELIDLNRQRSEQRQARQAERMAKFGRLAESVARAGRRSDDLRHGRQAAAREKAVGNRAKRDEARLAALRTRLGDLQLSDVAKRRFDQLPLAQEGFSARVPSSDTARPAPVALSTPPISHVERMLFDRIMRLEGKAPELRTPSPPRSQGNLDRAARKSLEAQRATSIRERQIEKHHIQRERVDSRQSILHRQVEKENTRVEKQRERIGNIQVNVGLGGGKRGGLAAASTFFSPGTVSAHSVPGSRLARETEQTTPASTRRFQSTQTLSSGRVRSPKPTSANAARPQREIPKTSQQLAFQSLSSVQQSMTTAAGVNPFVYGRQPTAGGRFIQPAASSGKMQPRVAHEIQNFAADATDELADGNEGVIQALQTMVSSFARAQNDLADELERQATESAFYNSV